MVKVYGVIHIKPTLGDILQELDKQTFLKDSYVFFEPGKSLIKQPEIADQKPIKEFIEGFVDYTKKRKIPIVPLNTNVMPSHLMGQMGFPEFNWSKLGKQFAEEEYMVNVIDNYQKDRKRNSSSDIVVMGGSHTPRLTKLLKEKNIPAEHIDLCPPTPALIWSREYREAALGEREDYASSFWVKKVNDSLYNSMFSNYVERKKEGEKVPSLDDLIENNSIFFKVYCQLIGKYMKKIDISENRVKMSDKVKKDMNDIKIKTFESMQYYKFETNHPVLKLWEE